MATKKKEFLVSTIDPKSITQIEGFVDKLFSQFQISETYYGNILMSLTEFISLIPNYQEGIGVKLTYKPGNQQAKVKIQPVSDELIVILDRKIDLKNVLDNEENKKIYIIKKLVDEIVLKSDNAVTFVFEVGALHNEVFEDRRNKLQTFFRAKTTQKVRGN
ncbi:MAG TPA: hypothetical protein ENH02_09175 [Bacteroidetes bacterium]|nr:hypothetical protein [Bacteroidota bacterium]